MKVKKSTATGPGVFILTVYANNNLYSLRIACDSSECVCTNRFFIYRYSANLLAGYVNTNAGKELSGRLYFTCD